VVIEDLAKRFDVKMPSLSPIDLDALLLPLQIGNQSWDEIFPVLNRSFGLSMSPEEWRELCCRIFTGEVPGMRDVLLELKNRFSLVALSNTIEVHWTFLLREYPIFELLDGWVVSYMAGAEKPHPAIYQALVDRYCDGRPPFFYTDDTAQHVEAARRLGWDAGVFRDSSGFMEDIQKRCSGLKA
jgi:FMN phosphatase YigB (HAD superfamily)